MTSIQPELWVENSGEAVRFYEAAFGAKVLHRVGEGDDIVAQLGVGDAAFWVAPTSAQMKRLSPRAIDLQTRRPSLRKTAKSCLRESAPHTRGCQSRLSRARIPDRGQMCASCVKGWSIPLLAGITFRLARRRSRSL
jgi:hypothetical protein